MRLIQQHWESYRARVIPKDAGGVQVEETRRAFYAGAAIVFGALIHGVSPGEEVQATDLRMMDDLQTELDEFLAEQGAKAAPRN